MLKVAYYLGLTWIALYCGYQLKLTEYARNGDHGRGQTIIERDQYIQKYENISSVIGHETNRNDGRSVKDVQVDDYEFQREMKDHEKNLINDLEIVKDVVKEETKQGIDIIPNTGNQV